MLVATLLHKDVQNFALIIDRPPQIHPPPADLHDRLVQMPPTRRSITAPTQIGGDQRPKLDHPAPDRLAADLDPALGHQLFDIADAQREPEIPAHRPDDHRRWEPVALERYQTHPASSHIAKEVRQTFRDMPCDPSEVRPLVEALLEKLGGDKLRRVWPAFQRDADFRRVIDGFIILLEESVERAADWNDALDKFEGRNEVALMTVHKSKGLEFHTMIFFGLDSRSWRGLQPGEDEEMNAFFVAFSRAAQRAFFTFCHARGGRIGWLEELLGEAVPRVRLTVE